MDMEEGAIIYKYSTASTVKFIKVQVCLFFSQEVVLFFGNILTVRF